jgi:hypothetical protein
VKAICKTDYGQFEYNKVYNYSYAFQNNMKKYYVIGEYGDNEFTKRQFDAIFQEKITTNIPNKNYNCL